ncbi:hypothetical protein ACX0G9_07230 [Flavitalea flava]
MKHSLLITSLFLAFFSMNAIAQKDSSGIYKTAADFEKGKLYLAIDCRTESHKIKLNEFFDKDFITVKHEGGSYDLKKNEIYAYKLCDGKIYRFQGKENYLMLNSSEKIILYTVEVPNIGKGAIPAKVAYYYSKDLDSPIQELSKESLKAAFPTNHKFHDALDESFKNDADLASYDSFHKMYKVNHVMEMNGN